MTVGRRVSGSSSSTIASRTSLSEVQLLPTSTGHCQTYNYCSSTANRLLDSVVHTDPGLILVLRPAVGLCGVQHRDPKLPCPMDRRQRPGFVVLARVVEAHGRDAVQEKPAAIMRVAANSLWRQRIRWLECRANSDLQLDCLRRRPLGTQASKTAGLQAKAALAAGCSQRGRGRVPEGPGQGSRAAALVTLVRRTTCSRAPVQRP